MAETNYPSGTKSTDTALDAAIDRAQEYLLKEQYGEGYWWGELESNPTMEAEYILLTHFLGVVDESRQRKLARHIVDRQREDGTWGQYYGAPGDLSTSTECYFALKLAGHSAEEPLMQKAQEFILAGGGIPKTRVFTKIWLALFGQWDWTGVPVMPPEIMLLPNWAPVTIYDFSSWARATFVPIMILLDKKPVRSIPRSAHVNELYPEPNTNRKHSLGRPKRLVGWATLFYAADTLMRYLERLPWKPTRSVAIRRAERWIVDHQESDGSWGGIQPPWVYSLMALHVLGYPNDHPAVAKGLAGFEAFAIDEGESMRMQACISPLWDTCLAMIALLDSGVAPDHPALAKAGQWFLDKQVSRAGDWQVKAKGVPSGGWPFEFHNDIYPDLDDTSEVVMALDRTVLPSAERKRKAVDRAVQWTLGMQSKNGGWGAFDKNNSKSLIGKIPFADFGETLDPPSADVTAHVIEMLAQLGYGRDHPAVARGVDYLLSEQEDDGPWFGRWGVNYIYGTAAVLPALRALDWEMRSETVRRAVDWIVGHQNLDGGWGESCASYVDPAYRGRGPSTPSQTAWAVLSLLAANERGHEATRRGVDHLVRTQRADGSWDEPYFTGTGFPGYGAGERRTRYLAPEDPGFQGKELRAGFMINYHMYRNYWPLMALGRYRTATGPAPHPSRSGARRRSAVAA